MFDKELFKKWVNGTEVQWQSKATGVWRDYPGFKTADPEVALKDWNEFGMRERRESYKYSIALFRDSKTCWTASVSTVSDPYDKIMDVWERGPTFVRWLAKDVEFPTP